MEFQLAEVVGFCAVWLASLFILALTFRFYMPVMVLPNLIVLMLSFLVSFIAASELRSHLYEQQHSVAILIRLVDMNKYFQVDEYDEAFLTYVCATYFMWMFVNVAFIIVTFQFYKYVKGLETRDGNAEQGNNY